MAVLQRFRSMTARGLDAVGGERTTPSILMVATISATLGFVTPYAAHFRRLGWRVDAAANGTSVDAGVQGVFDQLHELGLSRSIFDIGGIVRAMKDLSRILESGYDIVHVHTSIAAFLTRLAIRRMPAASRPAAIYTAHGFHFYRHGNRVTNALFRTVERIAGRWTDRLVVINDEDHASVLRHRIVPRHRLVLMPGIGLDTEWYSRSAVSSAQIASARSGLGVESATPIFVVVGELTARKRPYDVVAALGLMRHRDSHLVLLGEGPERHRVETQIQESGLIDRVHVVGAVPDVRPTVAASAALVLASRMEGLPRCVMEALTLEVPVVVTDVRGSPDLVAPDAGIVVPFGDVHGLARAMDRILDDPEEARAMALRGRQRMVQRHELSILIAQHEALYRDLLAERAR